MAPEQIWQAVLGELQLSVQRPVYDNWLRDTTAIAYEDGSFLVATQSPFAQEWLDQRMKGMIKQRLQRLCGRTVELRFIVRPEPVQDAETARTEPPLLQSPGAEAGRYRSAPLIPPAASLNPTMTFETFIEGDGNRLAHAASQAVAQDPGNHYNPLFLYGGVGLGKTHLLHGIGNCAARRGYMVRYVTSETFTNDLIEAIRTKSNPSFRQTYRDVDVLLIDDIQFIEGKSSTQNEVFHTFNSLYAANKQIVIASDRPPQLLNNLEARLRSRFVGGLAADLQPPDLEHRIAILRAKAVENGLVIPEAVLDFIAERFISNVRELQGALNRVIAYSRHHGLRMEPALAQRALGEPALDFDRDPEAMIQAVAEEFRISVAEIKGPRRPQRIVVARQTAMYLLREVGQLSFPQIGELLGGRDHTTIMHGAERMTERMAADSELQNRVERVRLRLARPG